MNTGIIDMTINNTRFIASNEKMIPEENFKKNAAIIQGNGGYSIIHADKNYWEWFFL